MPAAIQSGSRLVDELWGLARSKVVFPTHLADHDVSWQDRYRAGARLSIRSHERHECRTHGVLIYESDLLGIVTKDLSRSGIGFYAPLELRAGAPAVVLMVGARLLRLRLRRSRQVGVRCFDCGATFVTED